MALKYRLEFTQAFTKDLKKLVQKDPNLKPRVEKVLNQLTIDPFYPGLKTHKAQTKGNGECQSSRVTGDLRIAWNFVNDNEVILLIAIGGHSGKHKVYN